MAVDEGNLHQPGVDEGSLHQQPGAQLSSDTLLAVDPYQQELHQTLMVVHGRQGELGQVQTWYDICLRRLQHELDVEPTETTYRIFARAIRGELREKPMAA